MDEYKEMANIFFYIVNWCWKLFVSFPVLFSSVMHISKTSWDSFLRTVDHSSRRNIPLYTYMLLHPVFYIHAPSVGAKFSVPSTVHEIRSKQTAKTAALLTFGLSTEIPTY